MTFVIVNPGGTGPQLGAEDSVDLTPDQTQAATATLLTLIAVAWYVLVVVARPYNWWKIVLLSVSAGAYVLRSSWSPWSQDMFCSASTTRKLMVGAISAAVGIVPWRSWRRCSLPGQRGQPDRRLGWCSITAFGVRTPNDHDRNERWIGGIVNKGQAGDRRTRT